MPCECVTDSSVVNQSFVGFTATSRLAAASGTPEHDLTIGAAAERVEVTKVMERNCLADFTYTVHAPKLKVKLLKFARQYVHGRKMHSFLSIN